MNLTNKYALECGINPSIPHISKSFYPISFDKFIIIQNEEGEKYNAYNETIEYVRPLLNKKGIKIIQICLSENEETIYGAEKICRISLSQFNYLIEKSICTVSNSKYTADVSRATQTSSILLTKQPQNKQPNNEWEKGKTANLSINSFSEEVAKFILDFCSIENNLKCLETVFCGENYNRKILEIVPDFDITNSSIKNQNINIRADYHFDRKNIINCILYNTSNLITSKIPDLSIIPKDILQKNLIQINIEVDQTTKEEDIEALKKLNIKTNLFSKDKENIQKIRLNLINETIELDNRVQKKELDIKGEICNNTIYKSSKMLVSKNNFYTSKASWLASQPIPRNQQNYTEKVIDSEDFWEESEHFKLININHE